MRISASAYRAVLRLYPRGFRADVGAELLGGLESGRRREQQLGGVKAGLLYALRQLWDLVRNLPREWRSSRRSAFYPPARSRITMVLNELILHDLRYALRSLARSPVSTALIVVILALGIGSNAAAFSVLRSVLLDPLGYPQADRLAYLNESFRETQTKSVSYPTYLDWRDQAATFEDLGARTFWNFNLTGLGEAQQRSAMLVSANLFEVLGAQPALGRGISAQEEEAGTKVVLISDGLWQRELGADPAVLGRSLTLDDEPFTIVGVMPGDLEFPLAGVDLWAPMTVLSERDRSVRSSHPGIAVIGRLTDGATLDRAQDDMNAIAARLAADYPETNTEADANVFGLLDRLVRGSRSLLLMLASAVGLMLLVACVNVANLLVARAGERRAELAMRAAIGAGHGRILRQLVAESLLLAGLGGALGVGLAYRLLSALRTLQLADIPRLQSLQLDGSILLFAAATSMLCGLIFGVLPGLHGADADPSEALGEEGATRGGSKRTAHLRRGLIVAEIALSFVLLAGAGLMLRSLGNLLATEPGYRTDNVITAFVPAPQTSYPETADRARLYRELLERVAALPGVDAVAGIDPLPLSGYNRQWGISPDGVANVDESGLRVDQANVTPGYFSTMDIPLLAGRDFTGDETPETWDVIVDETLAARLWPEAEGAAGKAVGQRLRFNSDEAPWMTVVGVVGHVKNYGVNAESRVQTYLPYGTNVWGLSLVVRSRDDASGGTPPVDRAALISELRRELTALDASIPLTRVATMRDLFDATIAGEQAAATLLSAFAAVAVAIAGLGLYGVIAYLVNRRRRELGIRLALGASSGQVLGGVLREGFLLGCVGVALGLGGTWMLAGLLSGLVFGVEPYDPPTLLATAIAMLSLTLVATGLPARRAAQVDPTHALRS